MAEVIKGRNYEKTQVAFGCDGGKRKLLLGCSLFDVANEDNNKLAGGIKASSAKAWILLASVDDCPENYENLRIIFRALKFPSFLSQF